MPERASTFHVSVGTNAGNLAVGDRAVAANAVQSGAGPKLAISGEPLDAVLARLRDEAIAPLRARVAAEAPAAVRDEALAQVTALDEALAAPAPQLGTMSRVREWFARHLPKLAGGVTSVVLHPLAGRLVEAAGDALVAEFERRFDAKPGSGAAKPAGG